MREPFEPVEPEWLIRANAGLPPIKKTSELPNIIPPLPEGDTKDLKIWREYWKQHDAAVRKQERERVIREIDDMIKTLKEILTDTQFSPTHDKLEFKIGVYEECKNLITETSTPTKQEQPGFKDGEFEIFIKDVQLIGQQRDQGNGKVRAF